jgi:hypothetical protein
MSGTPTTSGDTQVSVVAYDKDGNSNAVTISISIEASAAVVELPPEWANLRTSPVIGDWLPAMFLNVDEPVTFNLNTLLSNSGGSAETFSATNNITGTEFAPGLVLDPATGIVTGTPNFSNLYTVELEAENQWGLSSTVHMLVEITTPQTGVLPVWGYAHDDVVIDFQVTQGEPAFEFDLSNYVTYDNEPRSFTWEQAGALALPAEATFNFNTGVIVTPLPDVGTFSYRATATNREGTTSSGVFQITVIPA